MSSLNGAPLGFTRQDCPTCKELSLFRATVEGSRCVHCGYLVTARPVEFKPLRTVRRRGEFERREP